MSRISVVVLALLLAPAAALGGATFTGVGDLPGGAFASQALDVSADGAVVVGISGVDPFNNDPEPFIWRSGSIASIAGESGPSDVFRSAVVSGDGSTVFVGGMGAVYRWTEAAGLEAFPSSSVAAHPRAVSFDGSVVTGDLDRGHQPAPYIWTETLGEVLLPMSGPEGGWAFAISADGNTVVGVDNNIFLGSVRWDDGIQSSINDQLRGLYASDITRDGSVIVGRYRDDVIRWENGAVQILPVGLPRMGFGRRGSPFRVGGDGWVLVGSGTGSVAGSSAFIWDTASGLRTIESFLSSSFGLDLPGWTLMEATAISDDGRTIVGNGRNPDGKREGWVVTLPPACSDTLDDDGDGLIDFPEDLGCDTPEDTSERSAVLQCDDGIDNDADGSIDFGRDPGCVHSLGIESTQCDDGLDNDGNGSVDWDGAGFGEADRGCSSPTDNTERSGCGMGFELTLLLPALVWLHRRRLH